MKINIDTLLEERAIYQQLCAIARAMDNREWSALESIFSEEVTADLGDGHDITGRKNFIAALTKYLGNCGPTQHLLGNLVVRFSGDFAESTCYVRDMHQGRSGREHLFLSTPGEYRDQWRKTDGHWHLLHRTKINLMLIGSIEALGIDF